MPDDAPWYADGLRFTCTQCGKCCTGEPGVVWVSDAELAALARYRGELPHEFRRSFTARRQGRTTLLEKENGDCVFWDKARGCTVYPVRPAQCRTWPFWESNLTSPERWEQVEGVCPGSGQGELIPVEEITRRVREVRM